MAGARRVFRRAPLTYQPAYKPGSVRHVARATCVTAIPLGRRLPAASSNLPERLIRTGPETCVPRRSYSVLLPVGFAVPPALPPARCALTAPFHPYPSKLSRRRAVCSLWHFPWGCPRRTLSGTVCPWSPDFPPRPPFGEMPERPSSRLTLIAMGRSSVRVKRRGVNHSSGVGRVSISARSVVVVESSAMPSTRPGRKWRWNAATTMRVSSS